jgi:hypothetical protein
MQGRDVNYVPPEVSDYGDLAAITAAAHPLLGVAAAPDMSFSSPPGAHGAGSGFGVQAADAGGPGPGAPAGMPSGGGGVHGAHSSGGTVAGGGGGGSAGGGGAGELPFTGFAAGAVAAIGSGLAWAGFALRRAATRSKS